MSSKIYIEGYWEGVRDAFELVFNFLDWKDENKDIARPVKEVVLETLEMVSEKVRPGLKQTLGVKFTKKAD